MPSIYDLLAAGYKPEQIITCPRNPCPCVKYGPQRNCALSHEVTKLEAPEFQQSTPT